MKEFNDFEDMMENQQGLKHDEKFIWIKPIENDPDFELVGDYVAIYAHSLSANKAKMFADVNKLNVITECIHDNEDDGTTYGYVRGFAHVNRERYFFTKKNDEIECEEVC